jgi:hypothetical protein
MKLSRLRSLVTLDDYVELVTDVIQKFFGFIVPDLNEIKCSWRLLGATLDNRAYLTTETPLFRLKTWRKRLPVFLDQ